jgi:disulfide bond formation protein DsbB
MRTIESIRHVLSSPPPAVVAAVVAVASMAAVAVALAAEHLFGVLGCTLCVYQRLPYVATAALALVGILPRITPARLRLLLAACAIVFAAGSALAFYHAGVQQGWWTEPGVCEGALPSAATIIDLRAATATRPACSDVDWSIMGLSLAALNGLYSAVLAAGCAIFAIRGFGPTPLSATHH